MRSPVGVSSCATESVSAACIGSVVRVCIVVTPSAGREGLVDPALPDAGIVAG